MEELPKLKAKNIIWDEQKLQSMNKRELISSYKELLSRYKAIQQTQSFEKRRIALLELTSYLRGEIDDFRTLSLEAKLLMRYLISCRRYWRWKKRFKIHPDLQAQLNLLKADLISAEERVPIISFINGSKKAGKHKWQKWEDRVVLDSQSDIAAAYKIGRSESAVSNRRKLLRRNEK